MKKKTTTRDIKIRLKDDVLVVFVVVVVDPETKNKHVLES